VEGQADEENPCPVAGCNVWFVPSEHRPIKRQKTDRERLTDEQRERLRTVREMVRDGLLRYGLEECSFSWSFGLPNWMGRTTWYDDGHLHIELSVAWTLGRDLSQARDTVAHELAHLLSNDSGHGPQWRQVAERLGCSDFSSCGTD